MDYFILLNDIQQGPYTIDELRRRGIDQGTLVWCDGMEQWAPAWQVDELRQLFFDDGAPQAEPPVVAPPAWQGAHAAREAMCVDVPQQVERPRPTEADDRGGRRDDRRRPSHTGLWAFLALTAVALFVLALTNPGVAEHRRAIYGSVDRVADRVSDIGDPTVRGIVEAVTGISGGMVRQLAYSLLDESLEYHNYVFFSTTTIRGDRPGSETRTSVGVLGHVKAMSLTGVVPALMKRYMGGAWGVDGFDNGTMEQTVTTVDADGNATTETTRTTRRNGMTVDSLSKRVTNRIADEVARRVKSEVRLQADSATASGVDDIVNDVLRFVKGL